MCTGRMKSVFQRPCEVKGIVRRSFVGEGRAPLTCVYKLGMTLAKVVRWVWLMVQPWKELQGRHPIPTVVECAG